MADNLNFIVIINEEIATTLSNSGFYYVKENINNNQTVYVFEKSEKLIAELLTLCDGDSSKIVYVEDCRLNF